MIKFIFLMIFVIVLIKCVENKLIIRFDTFLRKGFKKNYDKYGVFCWVRKATEMGKHTVVATTFQKLEAIKKLLQISINIIY